MSPKLGMEPVRKKQILAAMKKCVIDKGFQQTSIREIAKASGLSVGLINYYFGSKEKLLAELMQDLRREMEATLETHLPPYEDPERMLRSILSGYFGHLKKSREYLAIFVNLLGVSFKDEGIREITARSYAKYRYSIRAVIEFGISEGIFREVEANRVSSIIMAFTDGLPIQWMMDPDTVTLGEESRLFEEMVLGYLKK